MKALVVAGWYPPCEAWPTAARRMSMFVEGLAERGWEPTVLVPDFTGGLCPCAACVGGATPDFAHVRRVAVAPTRLRALARAVRHRRGTMRGSDAVVTPATGGSGLAWALLGMQTTWIQAAVAEGLAIPSDVLLTTCGPFENVRIGHRLSSGRQLPWVADLRDPASVDVTFEGTRVEQLVRETRRPLRRMLQGADRLIAATAQVVERDAPWLERDVELLIPGYDEQEWSEARLVAPREHERFEVVFAGRLYPGYRGPTCFLRGLRLFHERYPGRTVHLVYYGRDGRALRDAAEHERCGHLVEDRGFIAPHDMAANLVRASLLLLLTNEAADSGVPGGKFFEYLGAHRPILAVPGGDSFVESALRRTGAGVAASTPEAVADHLHLEYRRWQEHGINDYRGRLDQVAAFSSGDSIDRLDGILREVSRR